MSPAVHSSFSPLYTANMNGYNTNSDDDLQHTPPQDTMVIPPQVRSYDATIPYEQKDLIQHYMSNVLPIQYLLSDMSSISSFIYHLIRSSPSARNAACVLAAIHREATNYSTYPDGRNGTAEFLVGRLSLSLKQKTEVTEGDAMAGLHAISTILFRGGRGSWENFLCVASEYVREVLENNKFYGPEDVMMRCTESTRFIIKTTMWFDVLASVTTQSVPRFLETYKQLFDTPSGAYIEDPANYTWNGMRRSPPQTSMLPVMGCENSIVLAIAEISELAYWKEMQIRKNSLSVPQLVERGMEIERKYLTPSGPSVLRPDMPHPELMQPQQAGMYGRHGHPNGGSGLNGMQNGMQAPMGKIRRQYTNDIFRASARLYLHTVLSGDYPSCPEIIESVTEVIQCLERVPLERSMLSRSVLRSVVFGICIAGCLTENPRQRDFLMRLLDSQEGEPVGNLRQVRELMRQVWERRNHMHGQAVNWREVMRSQGELLLV
ncbi:fungal-specific transcription factor domain-containing protein [Irpex rosettiformis]|uniref:Fungal-specific transcription factor domain-containing protein n=1 Tax=Irpex rosettiformis TaxID=378272 RepID=A0ACB8U9W0_9APHY|nr:fungal-specific transcription factor domain-containing protein [Irpex rosettiformis]